MSAQSSSASPITTAAVPSPPPPPSSSSISTAAAAVSTFQQHQEQTREENETQPRTMVRTFRFNIKMHDRGTTVVDFKSLLNKARKELVPQSRSVAEMRRKRKQKRRKKVIMSDSESDDDDDDMEDDDDDVIIVERTDVEGSDGEETRSRKRLKRSGQVDGEGQGSEDNVAMDSGAEAGDSDGDDDEDDMGDFIVSDEDEGDDEGDYVLEDGEWVAADRGHNQPISRLEIVINNIEQRERALKRDLIAQRLKGRVEYVPITQDAETNKSGLHYEYDDFLDESEYNAVLEMEDDANNDDKDDEVAFLDGVLRYYVYRRKNKKSDTDDSESDSGAMDLDLEDPDLQQHVISFEPDRLSRATEETFRARSVVAPAASLGQEVARGVDNEDDAIELSPEMEECIKKLEAKLNSLDDSIIKANMIPREIDNEMLEVARRRVIDFKQGVPRGLVRRLQKLPNLERFTDQTIKQRMRMLLEKDVIVELRAAIEDLKLKLIEAVRKDLQTAWDKRVERNIQKKMREQTAPDAQQSLNNSPMPASQSQDNKTFPATSSGSGGMELTEREKSRLLGLKVDQAYVDLVNTIKKEGNVKVMWSEETENILLEIKKATEKWVNRENRYVAMRKIKGDTKLNKSEELAKILRSLRPLWPSQIHLSKKLQQIEEAQKRRKEREVLEKSTKEKSDEVTTEATKKAIGDTPEKESTSSTPTTGQQISGQHGTNSVSPTATDTATSSSKVSSVGSTKRKKSTAESGTDDSSSVKKKTKRRRKAVTLDQSSAKDGTSSKAVGVTPDAQSASVANSSSVPTSAIETSRPEKQQQQQQQQPVPVYIPTTNRPGSVSNTRNFSSIIADIRNLSQHVFLPLRADNSSIQQQEFQARPSQLSISQSSQQQLQHSMNAHIFGTPSQDKSGGQGGNLNNNAEN